MSVTERPLRVLLVGRYFWPFGALDAAGHLVELATGLRAAGIKVSVLTAKHGANQSDTFTFRDFQVDRPLRLFRSGWVTHRQRGVTAYVQGLREWMVHRCGGYDLIYCDGAREEAIAAVQAAGDLGLPVVVRMAGQGTAADLEYHASGRMGRRCRGAVRGADAVVFGDAAQQRRWLGEGGSVTQCRRIPIGVQPPPEDRRFSRADLRRAMSRINGDLLVPDAAAVVVSVERMMQTSGINVLVQSAYSLATHIHGLHFWLIGDGPMRDTIFTRLKGDGLRHALAMPGSFALLRDVLECADVMVHAGDEGFEHQVPTAISCGLPLVVANTEAARAFFGVGSRQVKRRLIGNGGASEYETTSPEEAGELVWWFDPQRTKTLRCAIEQIVANQRAARSRAERLRKRMLRLRPFDETIRRFGELFHQLVDEQPGRTRSTASSGEA